MRSDNASIRTFIKILQFWYKYSLHEYSLKACLFLNNKNGSHPVYQEEIEKYFTFS